ncbi:hypothetical protein HanPI659440_Chr08g0302711 [Helianthus annuus]|nr:hypothetical protein HanPI659440_Chr08g0302711 [Helianthus annuus]
MTWYLEHTVVYLTNPRQPLEPMAGFQDDGATVQMMADSLGAIHRSQDMEMMQQTAYQALNMSNLAEYTQHPTNMTNDPVDLSSYPCSQRMHRRRRRGRGAANVQDTGAGQWGRNYEEGGASGVNHEQNNEPNFNGLNAVDIGNVTNTFVDQNTVATHAIQSWQSLLASVVNEDPRYDISELLESTQPISGLNNDNGQFQYKNNNLNETQNNQAGFITPTSQVMPFFPSSQSDFQYHAPHQSHEDYRARYTNVEPNPLNWGEDLSLFPPPQ